MPSVDELCRSYLDLKYHFDPAAASSAGLVVARRAPGPVRPGHGARAHRRAAVGGRRRRGARDRGPAGGDRPHRAARRAPQHDLPIRARAPARAEPRPLDQPHLSGPVRRPEPEQRRGGRPRAGGARAAARHPRLPRDGAGYARRAAVGVRGQRAEHAGRWGRAGGAARGRARRRDPGAGGRAADRRGRGRSRRSSDSAPPCATRSSPAADPHAFAIGEEQFARRLHFEHAVAGGAPELWRYGLHLQEETTAQLVALAAELGARPWRELVDELRNDAPEPAELLGVYREELGRARGFVERAESGRGAGRAARGGPDAVVSGVAGAVRRLRAAAHLPQLAAGPLLRHPARPVAAADVAAQQRRGHCRHGIAAMVAHEAYPGHHLQLVTAQGLRLGSAPASLDADHGGRLGALLRAAPGRGGLLPDAGAAAVSAGEPALARHPGGAGRGPPHPGHDAGRGGGLHGRAPADRAAERGSRGAPLLRVADLPALLRRGPAGAAPAARCLPGGRRRRLSTPAGSTIRCWATAGCPSRSPAGGWTADGEGDCEDHGPDLSRQRKRELQGIRPGRPAGRAHPAPAGPPRLGARRPRRRQAPHRRALAPEARARLQPDGDVRRQRVRRHPRDRPARAARRQATPAAAPASCT